MGTGINIQGGLHIAGSGASIGIRPIVTEDLQLHLDAGNVTSYPGSGSTWTDLIASKAFTLYNSPTYSSSNGGYLNFSPSSSQYADTTTSLSSFSTWTVELWHYYDGTNAGVDAGGAGASLLTEKFTGSPMAINYSIGNDAAIGSPTDLQSGFFNGSWRATPSGYSLTANNWYHIVGTYDGSTIKLYVNGSVAQSTSYSGSISSSGHGIRLMRRWDNADFWGGRLAIVRIYSGDIGLSGVTQNFDAQRGRFGI